MGCRLSRGWRWRCVAKMHSDGDFHGNGKYNGDNAGSINEGQIISMEADLDKGTLRFWLDGQPHGPGWSSGVKGKLRWSVNMCFEGLCGLFTAIYDIYLYVIHR